MDFTIIDVARNGGGSIYATHKCFDVPGVPYEAEKTMYAISDGKTIFLYHEKRYEEILHSTDPILFTERFLLNACRKETAFLRMHGKGRSHRVLVMGKVMKGFGIDWNNVTIRNRPNGIMLSEATAEEIRLYQSKSHSPAASGLVVNNHLIYLTEEEKHILRLDKYGCFVQSYDGGRITLRAVRGTDDLMRMPNYASVRDPKGNYKVNAGAEFLVHFEETVYIHAFFISDNKISDGYQFDVTYGPDSITYSRKLVSCDKCKREIPSIEAIFPSARTLEDTAVRPVPTVKELEKTYGFTVPDDVFSMFEDRLDGSKDSGRTSSFTFYDTVFYDNLMEEFLETIPSPSKKGPAGSALRFGKKMNVKGDTAENILTAYKKALDDSRMSEGTKTNYVRFVKEFLDYLKK